MILVAAGGLARETAAAARAAGHAVRGCVDDDTGLHGRLLNGWLPVLGGLDQVRQHPDEPLVLCAGRGRVRRLLAGRLAEVGVTADRYTTVVHPSVDLPPSCAVGPGAVLLAGCVLTAAVRLGRHVVCMPGVTLTHDDTVDDYATLCAGVTLGGGVSVGEAAYLGMAASVREGVQVGADSLLGMGSVLLRDLPAGQTWAGNPARPLASGSADDGR